MDDHTLVPIALFVCALIAFKALLEAVIRLRLMHRGQNDAVLRTLIDADRYQRRTGALRSGIAFVALALGMAVVQAFDWHYVTPGAVSAIVLPLGIGELVFYFLTERLNARATP